ncbi:MAG: hypothetical protein N2D54_05235, partial [Chloroflexota bacterium]
LDENLDIYVQPTAGNGEALRVTFDLGLDFQPSWKPGEQSLAFTSNRGGANNIWLMDIDQIGEDDYLTQLTNNPGVDQSRPAWSPDGTQLAWVLPYYGFESIFVADPEVGETSAAYIGSGSQAVWSPTGDYMLTTIRTPDHHFLGVYDLADNSFRLPPFSLPGGVGGASWGPQEFVNFPSSIQTQAQITPEISWQEGLTPAPGSLFGRQFTLEIPELKAPHPALNALAVAPFFALRERVKNELSWDLLSDLENAYVPLTQPLPPGQGNNWLYTGRAIALNSVLMDLDWMRVVREDFGNETYWRVFIKTRFQDGSQGKPMTQFPWNFKARFTGNTTFYEDGGTKEGTIPAGYWVDFSDLALEYGWERQAASSNWRSFYQGARFNIFVISSGLKWESAMLQLYPPEIFSNP